LVVALLFLGLFVTYFVWTMSGWIGWNSWFLAGFFSFFACITTANIISGFWWRTFKNNPVPEARVVAIVPIYEENEERVHEVVWSLIRQTRPPDHIYVMDDGSEFPLMGFDHPLVTWMRQENAGKRHAQAAMLAQFTKDDYDLIVTVDSDSVFDLDAVEHLMRAFHDPEVMATTAICYTANWRHNLMTRLTDINLQISTLQMRMLRSRMSIVTPTSGAIAVYRPWVFFDNMEDYLNSGSIGDDRRLSFYALMKGKVVTVNEAACETHLPETPRGIFKQRTRWSKSAWLGAPFVVTNLRPLVVFFYCYPLVFALAFPFAVAVLSTVWIRFGEPTLMYGVAFWFVTSFCMAGAAYASRPSMSLGNKILQVFLAGTLYPLWGLFLLRVAVYKAVLTLGDQSWGTRGAGAPEPEKVGVSSYTPDFSVEEITSMSKIEES
jgi:hyaluronan synthase